MLDIGLKAQFIFNFKHRPEVATTNYYNPMFGQASRGENLNTILKIQI